MKKIVMCFLVLFAVTGLFAQQPVVAVAPFDAVSGISAQEASMITRVFYIQLGNSRQVQLRDSGVVERVIREHNFQAGDWSNQQKTAELGRALNADWIVRGEMEKFGATILLTVSFYNIKTFGFEGGTYARLANADEMYDKMVPLVDNLIQTISGSGAGPSTGTGKVYKVGDTGPAGGIIFFDRGFTGDGWRYLEAAPAGAEFTAEWGTYNQNVANTTTALGFGKQNTRIIVDRLTALKETNKAAQICAEREINGYKDWFLPSRDELDWMYSNLHKKGLGGFGNTIYRSSSQVSRGYAWCRLFTDGSVFERSKDETWIIRAVRAF